LTLKEFRNALTSRKNSAPELDQISYKMLEQLPIEYKNCLLSMFNEIFLQGIFPSWKTSLVILIPKPGNKTVRPISLISCVCKLMEQILYQRLSWFIESRPILSEAQTGFRPFRACNFDHIDHGSEIWIPESIYYNRNMDIAGTFDNPFS